MAKKGQRIQFTLRCEVCGSQNYMSSKNKLNTKEKLNFNKFCRKCRKVTKHKEVDKLD